MKSSAVILSVDEESIDASGYREYQDTLKRIEWSIPNLQKLGGSVWLIPLPSGLPALSQIVSVCEFVSCKYKLLHIEHEPVWVNYNGQKAPVSQ